MAGGITPQRPGMSLAERSARTAAGGKEPIRWHDAGARHCWVTDLPGIPSRCPGLLVEWRAEGSTRWFGRVVYAVDEDGRTILVEAWVPAEHLDPTGD